MKNPSRPAGWKVTAFDVELLFIMQTSGYIIKEVFVDWENRDKSTTKHQTNINKYVRESLEMLLEIIRVKKNYYLGNYN